MQKQGKSPWLGSSACVDETALLLGGSWQSDARYVAGQPT